MFALRSSHVDEISDYQNACYVSSNEAAWRILEFPIHERDPPVQQLASLCSLILTWCEPSNPLDIYEHHKESMVEDFLHQQCTQLGNNDLSFNDDIFNLALNDLQDRVLSMGGRELSEYGLPHPQKVDDDRFARVYHREIDYNQAEQQAFGEQNVPLLTAQVYDCFCSMVDSNEGGIAPTSTGT